MAGLAVFAFTLSWALPAMAHTAFESSDPADGAVASGPVTEIVLVFSGEANPVGDGFVVLDPSGEIRMPSTAETDDQRTWRLSFEPPLENGLVAVRWNVQAPDAHPIDGSFTFHVEAVAAEAVTDTAPTAPMPASPHETTPSVGAEPTATSTIAPGTEADRQATNTDQSDLDAFLAGADQPSGTRAVGALGRLLSLAGVIIAVGALVFAGTVLTAEDERFLVIGWAVLAAAAVTLGAALELLSILGGQAQSWTAIDVGRLVDSMPASVGIRALSGLAFAASAIPLRRALKTIEVPQPVLVGAANSSADRETVPVNGDRSVARPRSDLGRYILVPALAAAAMLGSYSFDGHTVIAGNRLITSAVDAIHVLASAVWGGGIICLAAVLWVRRRRRQQLDGLTLGIRFSVVAALALALAGVAGVTLAIIILDSASELWSTPWGLLLVVKAAAVLAAAGLGVYNHFVVIPWMHRLPSDDGRSIRLRNVATVEASLVIVVVAVTALLVAANSN